MIETVLISLAQVVCGLIGKYLHDYDNSHSDWPQARFIYTEVIAALSIVLSLLWLLPFAGGFIHYPADLLISAAWCQLWRRLSLGWYHSWRLLQPIEGCRGILVHLGHLLARQYFGRRLVRPPHSTRCPCRR